MMSEQVQSCYVCSVDGSYSSIYLPDNTPIFVGRNVDTKITDAKCSRQQVWLCASYADQRVFVKQVGSHPSGLNGFKTQKDVKYVAKHGDCLEVLYGKYSYRMEFNPPPVGKCENASLKKRVRESDLDGDDVDVKSQTDKKSKMDDDGRDRETDVETLDASGRVDEENLDDDVDRETVNEILSKVEKKINHSAEPIPSCSTVVESTGILESSNVVEPTKEELWEEIDNRALLIYTSKGVESRSKIAAYDLDGTLIKTVSGLVFPKDCNDWQIIFPEVPGKLKKLHADNYKIVIFTNQGNLGIGKVKPSDFKLKIERIVKRLGVPIQVFIASGRSIYRKPVTGMWDTLVNYKNDGVVIDKDSSFFIGDTAGRQKDWAPKKKKDHSLADRLLALNIGLKFQTPEEHFLGQKSVPYVLPTFDPKALNKDVSICDPSDAKLTSKEQEVIIMVGGPGSGKSHVAKTYLTTYRHINRDTLGSWQKCVSTMDQALSQGKSVVVDNTNPDPVSRQKYIKVAEAHKVPVRCFVMKTESEHSKHNNKFRALTDNTHDTVSDIIINSYTDTKYQPIWRCIRFVKLLLLLSLRLYVHFFMNLQPYRKNYKPPSLEEGYTEIVSINFVPKFQTDKDQKLYEMYLLEK